MLREANAENASDEEIEVVGVVMAVEVVEEGKKAMPWSWNALTCSNCSRRCDDVAFEGINLYLSSCGNFYCENCHTSFHYETCKECQSLIHNFTKINF